MENMDAEKELIFVRGTISYFSWKEPFNRKHKPTLYFKGEINDEECTRWIKMNRYLKVFTEDHTLIPRPEYNKHLKYDHVYLVEAQLETWEWNEHDCMRIIAIRIIKDLGRNKYLNNPFSEE